ncbi:MAG: hypothetical protein H2069_07430 [Legionella sp.]|nr:hypothetical protein [Legionella sp.]
MKTDKYQYQTSDTYQEALKISLLAIREEWESNINDTKLRTSIKSKADPLLARLLNLNPSEKHKEINELYSPDSPSKLLNFFKDLLRIPGKQNGHTSFWPNNKQKIISGLIELTPIEFNKEVTSLSELLFNATVFRKSAFGDLFDELTTYFIDNTDRLERESYINYLKSTIGHYTMMIADNKKQLESMREATKDRKLYNRLGVERVASNNLSSQLALLKQKLEKSLESDNSFGVANVYNKRLATWNIDEKVFYPDGDKRLKIASAILPEPDVSCDSSNKETNNFDYNF